MIDTLEGAISASEFFRYPQQRIIFNNDAFRCIRVTSNIIIKGNIKNAKEITGIHQNTSGLK